MNCLEFFDRLDDLVAGTCPPGEREKAERHAAACSSCADLLADARARRATGAETSGLSGDEADAMLDGVLSRTSGGACRRAEALLADLAFEEPQDGGSADEQLLAAHLEHCSACSALAESLRAASRVLPTLADFDPGPGFTFEVLRATTRAAGPARVPRPIAWWRQWASRPRFAFELAYVATVLLLIVVGNPAASVQAASARTMTVAATGLERAREAWPGASALPVPSGVRALTGAASEVVAGGSGARGVIEGTLMRAVQAWEAAGAWLRAASAAASWQAREAWQQVKAWLGARDGRTTTEPGAQPARSQK